MVQWMSRGLAKAVGTLAALAILGGGLWSDDKPAGLGPDHGKGRIERPTKQVVAGSSGQIKPAKVDMGKYDIEVGTKAAVTRTAPVATLGTKFVNPKVAPGKVTWHPTFAAARSASARSGRPVLLFQMMGKLDDQFC